MQGISVVIPTYNEVENVEALAVRLDATLRLTKRSFELLFIDDHSTDGTVERLETLPARLPIRIQLKSGEKGKAFSLLQGFAAAKYGLIAMIDADLQYPPEALVDMLAALDAGADIVVANRRFRDVSWLRRTLSAGFHGIFAHGLHGLECDVQSGLKLFRAEISRRIEIKPTAWTFDLPFLILAREAGYTIGSVNIDFRPRLEGSSKISVVRASGEIGKEAIRLKLRKSVPINFLPEVSAKVGQGYHYKGRRFVHHTDLHHSQSAVYRLSVPQVLLIATGILLLGAAFVVNWHETAVILIAILTFLYFADLLFNFYLITRSFSKSPELHVSEPEISAHGSWPTYSIFCPLYKEWEVVPQFVEAMSAIEYPKDKLQVMLLLEEDDQVTVDKCRAMDLPAYFQIIVVPHSLPKTKPKACNYGLKQATGEYIVIYDAEDVPDPLQLKKAVVAFERVGAKTVCLQAKLNFYNPHQNILTRVFTAEYSLWFDLVLTGLQSIEAPIPLGGTSNHFRTADLQKLKGWDSFNVTEDCDLGIRLVKAGYQTALLDSTTMEEANSSILNWLPQRTRWIKGYIQTYLVHMRTPGQFARNWRTPDLLTFQLVVGGKILSMFINPLMWVTTIAYFVLRAQIGAEIESFFPTAILYMGAFSLVVGNFLYMYYYMIGCAKREQDDIIKYVFLVPFYWLAMSYCAWRAVYEVIRRPHHWAKTQHGLHLVVKNRVSQNIKDPITA
jgi:cellulose synthase/poly-beta-1,6-N-acetylglucosamine synthase-like glycosyltransferase